MSSILKKIARQKINGFKSVPIDHPNRAQHVFQCSSNLQCPDCGRLVSEMFELDGVPLSLGETGCQCLVCGWEAVFGGSLPWRPRP